MSKYPENERLKAVSDKSHAIGEFLEWLGGKDIVLAEYAGEGDRLYPTNRPIEGMLAEFFDIDLKKVEEEKREMLEEIRAARDLCEDDVTLCPHCHCMTYTIALNLCGKCGESKADDGS